MAIILLEHVNSDMIISTSHNFLFIHVPKTGGTSVKRALKRYANNRAFRELNRNRKSGKRPYQHRSIQHVYNILDQQAVDQLYKFAFVRNPWAYVASYYLYTKRHQRFVQRRTEVTFKEWVLGTSPKSILQKNYCQHTVPLTDKPQTSFLTRDGKLAMDFIGRYENLQRDFEHVCCNVGIETPQLTTANAAPDYDYREMYDDELIEHVAVHHATDIEQFGYTF